MRFPSKCGRAHTPGARQHLDGRFHWVLGLWTLARFLVPAALRITWDSRKNGHLGCQTARSFVFAIQQWRNLEPRPPLDCPVAPTGISKIQCRPRKPVLSRKCTAARKACVRVARKLVERPPACPLDQHKQLPVSCRGRARVWHGNRPIFSIEGGRKISVDHAAQRRTKLRVRPDVDVPCHTASNCTAEQRRVAWKTLFQIASNVPCLVHDVVAIGPALTPARAVILCRCSGPPSRPFLSATACPSPVPTASTISPSCRCGGSD